MKIAIGSDHRGIQVKEKLIDILQNAGNSVEDCGTNSEDSVDYPDIASAVATSVSKGDSDRGILICGTGIGMAITANKVHGVRAATCNDNFSTEMCRRHNDVNVLCLSGDLVGERPLDDMIQIFLDTAFEG
ncbi:MAG TPA: ribose 5-phosphate isomerase B, partial [Planctomycetaceae bacterium]|nr:ribose 5-phosphate isomerase B [Planctomycetaceae bacterium]